ncbi:MAG TPA: dipeptide ABC transporter ATP-binding protein [Actinomycetota bacterium]|nr:dipeptide ABC transporter ATP-binding protein [Actinomycetota bacterium]
MSVSVPAPTAPPTEVRETVISVNDIVKHFPVRTGLFGGKGSVHAVDGVSFDLHRGEAFGIVGESGSGKSTLASMLMMLEPPTSGTISFEGRDLASFHKAERRAYRRQVQMVFQDTVGSLDPRMTIGDVLSEPWAIHGTVPKRERARRARELLERVGLDPDHVNRYPHQFSGGQRQRIGIARALALEPKVLICDEPVSALDVSVQAQVLNLLKDLRDEFELTYIFIAHDLSVVRQVCERVAVMYLGKIVEVGTEDEVLLRPSHPYTQALLSALPDPERDLRRREAIVLSGDLPSAIEPPSGCRFRTRCWKAQQLCADEEPALVDRGTGHPAACHFVDLPAETPSTAGIER